MRFNVVIAKLMSLVSAAMRVRDSTPTSVTVREATEAIAMVLDLFAPHTAAEMWEVLGHTTPISFVAWPKPDARLDLHREVAAVVQVDGRVRARIRVSEQIGPDDLESLALKDPRVLKHIASDEPRIHVRAPNVVSIVNGEARCSTPR